MCSAQTAVKAEDKVRLCELTSLMSIAHYSRGQACEGLNKFLKAGQAYN